MPIYEYTCKACAHQFELLVLKTTTVECPDCKSRELDRLFSLPTVRSAGTTDRMLKDSKRRDSKQAAEINHAQRMYEASHDD